MKIIGKENKNGNSVNYKGFGKLPKYVMFDTNLTPEAKAEYALLCSYAGNGDTAYPSRNLMVDQLDISIGRFYRHFDLLLENGYIIKKQQKIGNKPYANNIYTLTKDLESPIKGYGFIPKAVMTDDNLDIMSKAIYAYMCCFKDAHTNIALVKKERLLYHMNIVESTYYKYFRPLVVLGYITVEKKPRNGHFPENIYILNDIPQPQTDNAPPAGELPYKNTVNKVTSSENTVNRFHSPENPAPEYAANNNAMFKDTNNPFPEYAANNNAVFKYAGNTSSNKTPVISPVYNTTLPNIINLSENNLPNTGDSASPDLSIDDFSSNLNVLAEKQNLILKQAQLFKENAKCSAPAPNPSNQNNAVYIPYNVRNAVSDTEINDVRRELADNNGDLHCFFNDNRKMAVAIRALFDASSASAVGVGVYDLIVSSTLKIASVAHDKLIKIGSGSYDRNTVINLLNEFIGISPDGTYFFEWADSFAAYYSSAITKYNIRCPIPYTQASIMHYLYVDYPMLKEKPAPAVEQRKSSFDIDLFWQKSVDKAMNSVDDDDDDDDLDVG